VLGLQCVRLGRAADREGDQSVLRAGDLKPVSAALYLAAADLGGAGRYGRGAGADAVSAFGALPCGRARVRAADPGAAFPWKILARCGFWLWAVCLRARRVWGDDDHRRQFWRGALSGDLRRADPGTERRQVALVPHRHRGRGAGETALCAAL